MNSELVSMLETVALWVVLYLGALGLSRLLGVSGNQLVKARQKLDRLYMRNSLTVKRFKAGKVSQISGVRRLNGLTSLAKRTLGHIDLYAFDHRDNKRIPALRSGVDSLFRSYRSLSIGFIKGENTQRSVSVLSDLGNSIEEVREKVAKELNGELKS